MRRAFIVVIAAVLAASSLLVGQTTDPILGTWVENIAKSKYDPGPPAKSRTKKVEPTGNGVKQIEDWVDAQDKSGHSEVVFTFDGKDTPQPNAQQPNTTLSAKRIGAYSFDTTRRVNGTVTVTTRTVVSRDGRMMTTTLTGTNAQGQSVHNVYVYDRQ